MSIPQSAGCDRRDLGALSSREALIDPVCPTSGGAVANRRAAMIPVLGSTSVVGATDFEDERMDVCSDADFSYDPDAEELIGRLQSFLRPPSPDRCRQRLMAPWLPQPQQTRDHVPFDEAGDLAHEIAARWRHKVAERIPDRRCH